jgi:hypothetical protein
MMVDEVAQQVNNIKHRQETLLRNAEDFVAGVVRERTPAATEISGTIGRALTDQIVADGWTAIAAAVTAMLRGVPEADRPTVMLGLSMIVDQMMDLPAK